MKKNIFASLAAAGLGVVTLAAPSFAATPLTGGTVTSTTSVAEECQWYAPGGTVSTSSAVTLAFGAYSPFSATALDGETPTSGAGALAVYCANGTAGITIELGNGTNGTATQRVMKDGTKTINYQLYKETARTTIWGGTAHTAGSALSANDATSAATPITTGTAAATQIFGRITANQDAAVGANYTDAVAITVNY